MKTKLFLFVALLCFGISSAQNFTVSGINYTVTSTTVPFTVKVVGKTVASGNAITIPETVTNASTTYTVTAIGNNAFYDDSITSVSLPSSLITIEQNAFEDTSSLTTVTFALPSSLTTIELSAFSGTGITSITIPNSVTTLGTYVFNGCYSLTSVTLPNMITSTPVGMFWNCPLTSITIPSTVTSVGPNAFNGCTALTSVTCLATTVPAINPNAFFGVTTSAIPLYVPFGTGAAYDATTVWTDFIINQLPYSGPIVPGQVGINTLNPLTTLDVDHKTPASPANDAGIAFPQVSNLPSSGVQAGQMVYNITDNYVYFFNGTTWSPIREVAIPALGSIKYSILANDHLGWYKLDGRLLTTLETTQQTNAAAINISGSLPDAESHVLKDNGTDPAFQTGGSDTVILTQGQMPSGVTGSGTTSSDGSHTHSFSDQYETGGVTGSGSGSYAGDGDGNINRTSSAVIHNHTYSFNLGDDTPISVEDAFLTVNVFIFLGL